MYPYPHTLPLRLLAAAALAMLLAGCELQIPGVYPDPKAIQRDAEAKAIGGACRHAMRGLEDCYTLNPKAPKAAVFTGWKDMDQYMRENKLEGTPSVISKTESKPEGKADKPAKSSSEDDGHETGGKKKG